jgi:hypothetical protein
MRHGFQLYICRVYSNLIDFAGVLPLDKKILNMRFRGFPFLLHGKWVAAF